MGIFSGTGGDEEDTKHRNLTARKNTRPLKTFQFLSIHERPKSKPESRWKTRGSGAEHSLEDGAVESSGFNPPPFHLFQATNPKPKAPLKRQRPPWGGDAPCVPIRGSEGTESSPPNTAHPQAGLRGFAGKATYLT